MPPRELYKVVSPLHEVLSGVDKSAWWREYASSGVQRKCER